MSRIDGEVLRTESLKTVIERMLPYWFSDITPDLAANKTTSPPASPLVYNFMPTGPSGYLDPDAAAAGAAAVAAQGAKK